MTSKMSYFDKNKSIKSHLNIRRSTIHHGAGKQKIDIPSPRVCLVHPGT